MPAEAAQEIRVEGDGADAGARRGDRGEDAPRPGRVRRRRRGRARASRALVPLRPDVVGRRRHRARAPAARRRRADPRAGSTARSTRSSKRAEEHRLTLTIGRTHGVHAEPTTFGLKLAVWAFELDRARERLARALEGVRVGKLSGAVGNYAAIDPEVERIACERLGLEPEPAATQVVQRDRHAELLSALAVDRRVARAVRARDPAPGADRGGRGAGAVRQGPEGLVGDAAQAEPGRRRADLRSRARRARGVARRARERRALARARHLALVGRAGDDSGRVPRARLHARPLRLARRGPRRPPRADAAQPRAQPRPLLQPAPPARARRRGALARRGVPARPGPRDARLGGGARLPRARSRRRGDRQAPRRGSARRDLRSRPLHAPRRHRLRAPARITNKEEPVHA